MISLFPQKNISYAFECYSAATANGFYQNQEYPNLADFLFRSARCLIIVSRVPYANAQAMEFRQPSKEISQDVNSMGNNKCSTGYENMTSFQLLFLGTNGGIGIFLLFCVEMSTCCLTDACASLPLPWIVDPPLQSSGYLWVLVTSRDCDISLDVSATHSEN